MTSNMTFSVVEFSSYFCKIPFFRWVLVNQGFQIVCVSSRVFADKSLMGFGLYVNLLKSDGPAFNLGWGFGS